MIVLQEKHKAKCTFGMIIMASCAIELLEVREVNATEICNYRCQTKSKSVIIIRHPSLVRKAKFRTHIKLQVNVNFISPK
jgi:hypothetical protein